MTRLNLDPDLYDEEEQEMLASFEQGEWHSYPDPEARLKHYQELFRAARASGNLGPVSYDNPYPWSGQNRPDGP